MQHLPHLFVLPLTGSLGRVYVPKGLRREDIGAFRERLRKLHTKPAIGYCDRNARGRFVEY